MLTKSNLEKIDTYNIHKIYDTWDEIANTSYNSNLKPITIQGVNHIVFAGMGGSGTLGDFFSAILSKTNIHVTVVKGYQLPKTVNSDSLVVVTSVSGNTTETLAVLESALNIGCHIVGFSSGGRIEEICKEHKTDFCKIAKFHSPRASFVSFLYCMLRVLGPCIRVSAKEIQESITQLKTTRENISSHNLNPTNYALHLAEMIQKMPLIYYPWGLQAAAIRFKASLQENAKMHVIIEDIIEASHNGIVSWEKPSSVMPVLLQGVDDHPKTIQRWKIFKDYFKENGITYEVVQSVEGGIVSKLVNLFYLLDYASIYRAILDGVDPTPVESIDYVKDRL